MILFLFIFSYTVRGEVVCNEAEELEMPLERYIEDVEQAFTGRENSNTYNFTLTPNPPGHSSTLTLTYEKMQKDISVSAACLTHEWVRPNISLWHPDSSGLDKQCSVVKLAHFWPILSRLFSRATVVGSARVSL